MRKNYISIKLSIYFGVALLSFALVIGIMFFTLFRNNVVEYNKNEMIYNAAAIASTLSSYKNMSHGSNYSTYLKNISEVLDGDIWVVDENLNIITNNNCKKHMHEKNTITYKDIPKNAEKVIDKVFKDETLFCEDFSDVLLEPSITAGAPIKDSQNKVIGAVLIHSPVKGVNEYVKNGIFLLVISILVGLFISFVLSIALSKNFTDPIILKEAQDTIKLEKIRSDFVANISHELKTPVTVIRGSLEALIEKVVTDDDLVEQYYNNMLNEAVSLQRLVGDLLDLSKLQNQDFLIEKNEFSLGLLLDEVIRSAQQISNKKNIKICLEKDNDYIIYGDYGRLRQMILIILDNAIKFSYENSEVKINLKNFILEVCDSGIGIKKEELPYIFDRFRKVRVKENSTGTGLGLSIAKEIANRHNIKINVDSSEERGSIFGLNFTKCVKNYKM